MRKEEIALEYLYIRGINDEMIDKFQLGYTYSNIGWLKFKTPSVFFGKKNNRYYDRLSNRIIIPIFKDNNVEFVTSRSIYNDCIKPHLHICEKINYAFNQDILKISNYVIIVESPLDTIQLEQRNLRSIATMGANMAPDLELANDLMHKKVYICFDNDLNKAGLKGAISLSMKLNSYKINSKIVVLPTNGKKNDISIYFKNYSRLDFINLMKQSLSIKSIINTTMGYNNKKIEKDNRPHNHHETTNNQEIILCPFHPDHNPSLVIYHDTDSFFCFGCRKYGTIEFLNNYLEKGVRQ